jgi:hypothetical protein
VMQVQVQVQVHIPQTAGAACTVKADVTFLAMLLCRQLQSLSPVPHSLAPGIKFINLTRGPQTKVEQLQGCAPGRAVSHKCLHSCEIQCDEKLRFHQHKACIQTVAEVH